MTASLSLYYVLDYIGSIAMPKQDTEAVQARITKEFKKDKNWLAGKLANNCLAVNSNMGSKQNKWGSNDG